VEEQLGEVQAMLGRREALGEVHLGGGAGRRSAGRGEERGVLIDPVNWGYIRPLAIFWGCQNSSSATYKSGRRE
jgi:hypothetical protein